LPLRRFASAETRRKSAPFRVGNFPLSQALSVPLQNSVRFLRLSSTPSVIPLPCGRDTATSQWRGEWGLPCCPMWRRGWGGCAPIVRRVTVPPSSTVPIDEPTRVPFWPRPVSIFGRFSMTDLTMGVHVRSAVHPLLGRVRIGASRVRPLFPKLHTLDCSSACPGSSTWVDKVPSRDTPTLNLAGHRRGMALGAPQVARNQSKIGGLVDPPLRL
jgi:hypothetical protein